VGGEADPYTGEGESGETDDEEQLATITVCEAAPEGSGERCGATVNIDRRDRRKVTWKRNRRRSL
jgi:hypothetical protein